MTRRIPEPVVRLSVLGIIVTSLFVALFARLLFLQVIDGPKLAVAAKENQVRTVYEQAPRGRILDRNGQVLAGNREADVITVERDAVKKNPALLGRLATFLNTDENTLKARMDDPKASQYRPVVVADSVDKAVVASFRERQGEFVGASAETSVERWYPDGTLAAHVLGYVGDANDKELAAHKQQNYRLGDTIGKSGIESAYEDDLRGKPGVSKIEVDSSGRPVRVLDRTPPTPGRDVTLSLDVVVQRAAEDALTQGLQLARDTSSDNGGSGLPAKGGSVVAIDPHDGGVLAMASYPNFDPASFGNGIPAAEYAQLTDPKGDLPLENRAIQGQYAPGSTFKLTTSIAALKSKIINENSVITDGGSFTLGNRQFRNAQGKAYGPVALPRALTVSSDVFYYTLGDRIWNARKSLGDPIQANARDLGFGTHLGIDVGGEADGRVPDPATRKKLHDQRPDVYPEGDWFAGDNVNLAIGQGDTLATPLQIADAYATFANGGTLYKPRLVQKVSEPGGKVVKQFGGDVIRKVDIPANVKAPIEEGLAGAVKDPRGTAYSAFTGFDLNAFPVAGKTGTAQVADKGDNALFAAYGPTNDAQMAVSVVLEQAGFGGESAAPVARRVFAAKANQPVDPIHLGTSAD